MIRMCMYMHYINFRVQFELINSSYEGTISISIENRKY